MDVAVSCACSQIRRCLGGKSRLGGDGECRLNIVEECRLVVFHKPKVVAVRIDDLLGKITLAEHSVAGYQSPFENDASEQLESCLVLVGLVFAAVGNLCLSQR